MKNRFGLLGKVICLVVLAGLAIAPLDASIQKDRRELKYGGKALNVRLREQMGQGLAVAFLGGFRAIAADYLWIEMHNEWEKMSAPGEKKRWARIPPYLEAVTALQPQCDTFWSIGGWHMAFNISIAARNDVDEPNPKIREANYWDWVEKGKNFWIEGTKNMPNDATLFADLARLHEDPWKYQEPCTAAKYWELTLGKANCPTYAHRAVGYSLRQCAEKTRSTEDFRDAFDWWKRIWLRPHKNADEKLRTFQRGDTTVVLPAPELEMWPSVRREMGISRALALNFGALTPQEDAEFAQQEIALDVPPTARLFARDESALSEPELREAFNWWTYEWLRPHNDFTALWDFVRAKLVAVKNRVPPPPEAEARLAEQEEYAGFKIQTSERVFRRATPSPQQP